MTLDEAIEHCREKENCSACGQEHKQLRLWLEELRERRINDQRLTNALEHKGTVVIPAPHGRLIDADVLLSIIRKRLHENPEFDYIVGLVERQRTIIEMEE